MEKLDRCSAGGIPGVNDVYDPGDNLMNDSGVTQRCDCEINIPDIKSMSDQDLNSVCNTGIPQAFEPCNSQVMNHILDPHKSPILDPNCSQVCDPGITQVSDSQVFFPDINLCHLPDSLLLEIFSHLDANDVTHIAQVCQRLYSVAYDESLWRQLVCQRWKLKEKPACCRCLWRLEYQRLTDNVPTVLSETLTSHSDEVLHVSFSHDGSLFSTTSKDCTIKVWEVGFPTTLKYSQDFRIQFHWDFTQFSCFNATDTMLLVSSVKTAELDRRGYVAILSITHDFQLLQVLSMDPSQLFGTWLNPSKFLGGSLEISLERFITTVQIKAFEVENVPPPPDTDVSLPSLPGETLFTFSSENASLIKFLTVVNNPCVSQSCTKQKDALGEVHKGHLRQEYEGHLGQGHKCHLGQRHKCHLGQGHKCHLGQGHKCHLGQGKNDHFGQCFKTNKSEGLKGNSGQEHTCNLGPGNIASTSDTVHNKLPGRSNSHMGHQAANCVSDRNSSNNNSQEGCRHTNKNLDVSHSPYVSSSTSNFEATSDDVQMGHQAKSNDKKPLIDNKCLESSTCPSDCSKSPCLGEKQVKTSVEVKQEEGVAYSKLCFCCRKKKKNTTVQQTSDSDKINCEGNDDERLPLNSVRTDNQSDSNKNRSKQCEDFEMVDGEQERLVLEASCGNVQSEHSIIEHKPYLVDHKMADSDQETFHLTSACHDVQGTSCASSQADCANSRPRDSEDVYMEDSAQDGFLMLAECEICDSSYTELQTDHCDGRTQQCGEYSTSDSILTSETVGAEFLNVDSVPDNCKTNTQHSGCDHSGQHSPHCDHCNLHGHWSPQIEQGQMSSCCDQQRHWSLGCEQAQRPSFCDEQGHCLIYVTGEFAVALHQLGFKALYPESGSSSKTDRESLSSPADLDGVESHMVVNYSNQLIEMQQLRRPDVFDHLIDLHGHITGLCLSADHRYLFVNCRPWVGPVDRSDPWSTPELSPEIEVRVIDLCTMEMGPLRYVGHKGLSPSTMCCFIFLDTSDDFVGSGSEDCKAYVWERRYGCVVGELPHGPGVVNAVAFCPNNQEYLVTVSDDNTIRIWRSRHDMRLLQTR